MKVVVTSAKEVMW